MAVYVLRRAGDGGGREDFWNFKLEPTSWYTLMRSGGL